MIDRNFLFRIVENWPAKVLSVALALILFVFHRMSTMATRPLSVPLVVETSSTLVPASAYPQNVRIQLRGEDDGIKSIAENDIEAYVDLSRHETKGTYRAPVQIRKKGSALDVEPLEISVNPLEVSIQLDQKISKTLQVTADVRGKVASGFDMVSHSISPQEIIVSGPMGILENLLEIRTDPIDLDGRRTDFNVEVNIAKEYPFLALRGNGIALFHGLVRPSVPVRNIEGIPIVFDGLDPRFEADSGGRMGSVRIEGGQFELDDFVPDWDLLSVDCSAVSQPGIYTLPVTVRLPDGIFLIRGEPEELGITVFPREEDIPPEEGSF